MQSNQLLILALAVFINIKIYGQSKKDSTSSIGYNNTYDLLVKSLAEDLSFRNAVTDVENCFDTTSINGAEFDAAILSYTIALKNYSKKQKLKGYRFNDSASFLLNSSICRILKDTSTLNFDGIKIPLLPFTFNHLDPFGKQDITNTFVTKLLATHQGNCRSLTYLYKILADELGAKCWIALAPGHMYIKNYSEKIGWYNTELTSGTFPTDAWIMASSYIKPEAVKSGLFMDTLSNQQAIALCVLDLANFYERETHNYYDGFILKCCDLVLKYHSVNPMALLIKAETLKKVLIREQSSKFPKPTNTAQEMETTYLKLFNLGYREMPTKMKVQRQKEEKENAKKYGSPKASKN